MNMLWRRIGLSAFVALALGAAVAAYAQTAPGGGEVKRGDTEEEIIRALGEPRGRARIGDTEILYYGRGTVEMIDGRATTVDLVSEERAKAIREERRRRAEDIARRQQADRRKRIEEGEAEKERTLSDPGFTNRSPRDIVAYWDGFRGRHPEVPIDEESYGAAQQQLRGDEEAARRAEEEEKRKKEEEHKRWLLRAAARH